MSAYYNSTITLGGETLKIQAATPKKVPSVRKQIIGKSVIRIAIPGRNLFDWQITMSGIMFGSSSETERDALEALQDNQDKNGYAFTDGTHDGTYYIEDITFSDTDDANTIFRYTIRIIEKNQ